MRRKKKLLLIILGGIIFTFFIYKVCYEKKYDLVSLGDSLCYGQTLYNIKGYSFNDYLKDYYEKNNLLKSYNSDYCQNELNSQDILNAIANNSPTNDNLTIDQVLNKADIITIAVGLDEIDKSNINTYLSNIDSILKLIRGFNDNKIYVLGIFGNNNKIADINNWLSKIALKYNATYVSIIDINNKDYLFEENNKYVNYLGHKEIYKKILAN